MKKLRLRLAAIKEIDTFAYAYIVGQIQMVEEMIDGIKEQLGDLEAGKK